MKAQFFWGKVSDNQDPDKQHRVRVSIRGKENESSEWIPVITPYAGTEAGVYLLPNVDDQVAVISLDNACKDKVVLGAIWDDNAAPPETEENTEADLNQDGKNTLHFFKGKNGAMLILDDTEKSEKLQLISADPKTRLEFSEADKLITLNSEKDLSLNAKELLSFKAKEIEIKASKKITCKNKDLQIKADQKINIKAGQNICAKGSDIALN